MGRSVLSVPPLELDGEESKGVERRRVLRSPRLLCLPGKGTRTDEGEYVKGELGERL